MLTGSFIQQLSSRTSESAGMVSTTSPRRNNPWDYARGLGILLVVYGHVLRGLSTVGIVHDDHWLMPTDYAIYTFHMPLFFLLAGMNVFKGFSKEHFLRSKLLTIVYPYVLWSVVQGTIQVVMSSAANSSVHWVDIVTIVWKPIGQFWFLYALLLCHLFIVLTTINRTAVMLFAFLGYIAGMYFSLGILSTALKFFPFYAMGLLSAPYLEKWVIGSINTRGVVMSVIFFSISLYAAMLLGSFHSPWALPAALSGIFLILQFSAILSKLNKLHWIELLGLASMPVYLLHIIFASGGRVILVKLGVTDIYLHLIFGCLFGIIFPLLFYYFTYLMNKEKLAGFNNASLVFKRLTVN